MPPRTVKRGAGSAGTKRTTRATRGAPKAQNQAQPDAPEVSVPVAEGKEELKVEKKPIVEEDPVVEDKPVAIDRSGFEGDAKSDQNGFKSKICFLLIIVCFSINLIYLFMHYLMGLSNVGVVLIFC